MDLKKREVPVYGISLLSYLNFMKGRIISIDLLVFSELNFLGKGLQRITPA
jgi:hypothetical protein